MEQIATKQEREEISLGILKATSLAQIINLKTDLCCIIDDAAYVHESRINIYKTKSANEKKPVIFELNYDFDYKYYNSKQVKHEVERCIGFLEKFLQDGKIDYSILDAVTEYVITHYV